MNVDPSSPFSRGRGRRIWSGTRPVIAYGMPPLGWRDLYHRALTVTWPVFFLSLAVLFLLTGAVTCLGDLTAFLLRVPPLSWLLGHGVDWLAGPLYYRGWCSARTSGTTRRRRGGGLFVIFDRFLFWLPRSIRANFPISSTSWDATGSKPSRSNRAPRSWRCWLRRGAGKCSTGGRSTILRAMATCRSPNS